MNKNIRFGFIVSVAIISGAFAWNALVEPTKPGLDSSETPGALVTVAVPEDLTSGAQVGQKLFEENCAACHGKNASGQAGIAPPLIHKIYEPSHHADESFQRAAAFGVRSHHWPFGNMPPIGDVNRADVTMIIAYVRELQRANGIF